MLGIDGLDAEKLDRWAPEIHQDISGTLSLEPFGDVYFTNEIWPSMILGKSPREYGWDPKREGAAKTSSATWETPGLNFLSNISENVIPHNFREQIGSLLEKTVEDPAAQLPKREFGDDHLFSGLKHRAIEVPNWNRGELDLKLTRESWEYVIDEEGGVERFFDAVDHEIRTISDEIHDSFSYPYDLVFTHYHYLDLIQHYFDEETQKQWYERTGELVSEFAEQYSDTTIIILSDHGLGDTEHRPPAYVTVSNPWTDTMPDTPLEVRSWLEEGLQKNIEANENVESTLEDLGYLEN